jgi:glycosyltransferase involved in cell wall biosynthesis
VQHYLAKLDLAALGRPGWRAWRDPRAVQDLRAERRYIRRAGVALALSQRVADAMGRPAWPVPIAYTPPDQPLELVDRPVAVMLADWRWAPNQAALRVLLEAWQEVAARVAGARLLLAGRGMHPDGAGPLPDVDVVGAVARVEDVLERAAVVAFPCLPTSGPKVKVLEALAHGLPVVTTRAGIEGIEGGSQGAVVTDRAGFGNALAALLGDPERRSILAKAGRATVLAHHAPVPAARARVAAIAAALGDS